MYTSIEYYNHCGCIYTVAINDNEKQARRQCIHSFEQLLNVLQHNR